MKVVTKKLLTGIAIATAIAIAVFLYWVFSPTSKPEGFYARPGGAQEQLASATTSVAPASDIPKTKQELAYLNDTTGLPPLVLDNSRIERPYLTDPINSLDDYEYNLIFQNEGSREMSDQIKNSLTSEYPFDWSELPPSAAEFQSGKSAMYQAAPTGHIPSDTYKAIEAASLQPPDMDAIEDEERKILATYVPKHAGDLTTYNVEDAKELIHKIYDAKGLKPEVVEQGNNVYQVVYTSPKDPKIEYEDDPSPSVGGQMYSNPKAFDVISVPQAPSDTSAALDPFYEPRNSVRTSRNDYTKWTPGLERMFAPTYEHKKWY
jgi:hypothetical protein